MIFSTIAFLTAIFGFGDINVAAADIARIF